MTRNATTITCDRAEGVWRVAVWQGGKLQDLCVDSIKNPSMVGAVLSGKVVRVIPAQKAAFIDCGLGEKVFATCKVEVKTGEKVFVLITSHARQGKAFSGKIVQVEKAMPAPKPWQRVFAFAKGRITFSNREDYEDCREYIDAALSKGPVHPDLDEIIDGLMEPRICMPGGTSIVIEQTEALVSIDINGDAAKNPLAINLQAAPEIARQIRLRNLSGIIVVDALKMVNRTDANKLLSAFRNAVAEEHAGVEVIGITKLGLVEMVRARKGPSLAEVMGEAGK